MPDRSLRDEVRAKLGITPDAIVIGHVARYDVQKDHRTFLQAVNQIRTRNASLNVIMVGEGVDWQNSDLTNELDRDEASQWLHLLGPRSDVAGLYNGDGYFLFFLHWRELSQRRFGSHDNGVTLCGDRCGGCSPDAWR